MTEEFMKNFRWITPLLLTILTALIGYQTHLIEKNYEMSISYTDKMVQMQSNTNGQVRKEIEQLGDTVSDIKVHIASLKTFIAKRLD